ncbi:MAG: hypothetical protein WD276_04215 [Actinomycetota bacterium]
MSVSSPGLPRRDRGAHSSGQRAAGRRSAIILGSGRSGTSMVAGLFHGSGFFMGPDLLAAMEGNPRGLFESRPVNVLNEELLAPAVALRPANLVGKALHYRRLAPSQLWLATPSPGAKIAEPDERQRRSMESWVANTPFALKDPRFCYTLEAWRPLLEDCAYVCVFREPDRTADSILRECKGERYLRNLRMTYERALSIWSRMYEWILNVHSKSGEWTFVHYGQVADGSGIERLEEVTGGELERSIVEPDLSRARARGSVPPAAGELYAELCRRAGMAP